MRRAAAVLAAALLGGCACGPRVIDLRPALASCLDQGMLPGAVKVDADGKLLEGVCLQVRLKRPEPGV